VLSASFDVATHLDLISPAAYVSRLFDVPVVLRAIEAALDEAA